MSNCGCVLTSRPVNYPAQSNGESIPRMCPVWLDVGRVRELEGESEKLGSISSCCLPPPASACPCLHPKMQPGNQTFPSSGPSLWLDGPWYNCNNVALNYIQLEVNMQPSTHSNVFIARMILQSRAWRNLQTPDNGVNCKQYTSHTNCLIQFFSWPLFNLLLAISGSDWWYLESHFNQIEVISMIICYISLELIV